MDNIYDLIVSISCIFYFFFCRTNYRISGLFSWDVVLGVSCFFVAFFFFLNCVNGCTLRYYVCYI